MLRPLDDTSGVLVDRAVILSIFEVRVGGVGCVCRFAPLVVVVVMLAAFLFGLPDTIVAAV